MNHDQAFNLFYLILEELESRVGFDHWWAGIALDDQVDIEEHVVKIIQEHG